MSRLRQLAEAVDRADARVRVWIRAARDHVLFHAEQIVELSRRRRVRIAGISFFAVLVLFGGFGFFGVPPILRHVLTTQVAAAVNRPITVGRIRFNPYRLKLDIDRLHIGERASAGPFVDVGHLRIKVSWTSIFRLAPIVKQVEVDVPSIHLVRTGAEEFNCSDLITPKQPPPQKPPAPSKPLRFAVSNIVLRDGAVTLDDRFLGEHHAIDRIQIGVPFIANLPADTDIYVQPLLQMTVDGSPLLIKGKAKPFATPPESVLNLNLHGLSLPRYLTYAPHKLPVRVPEGSLSCALRIRFVNAVPRPKVSVAGELAIDKLDIRDNADAPLLELAHMAIAVADLAPLESSAHLKRIFIDGLNPHLVRNADGTLNVAQLTASSGAANESAASQQQAPHPAPPQPPEPRPAAPAATPLIQNAASNNLPVLPTVSLDTFQLVHSSVNVTDNTGPQSAEVALQNIRVGIKNVSTSPQAAPAPYQVAATLSGGGTIAISGTVDVAKYAVTTEFGLDQLDLSALQKFAAPFVAAEIASGKLSAHATLRTSLAPNQFNVHIEPARLAIDSFDLRTPSDHQDAVGWKSVTVALSDADLASRNATVKEVHTDGVHVFVRRGAHGELSLASLMKPPAASTTQEKTKRKSNERRAARTRERREHSVRQRPRRPAPRSALAASQPAPGQAPWRVAVESIAVENTEARVRDESGARAVEMVAAPVNLRLGSVSSDLSKPISIALDGVINKKGGFAITGTATPDPLKADLRIKTKALDLAVLDPFLSKQLNASLVSAALTSDSAVRVQRERDKIRASYRGDVTVGNVRMLDKLTGDTFVRWNSFRVNRIDARYGEGKPRVRIGDVALSDFYARVILNKDGKLNLSDITTSPEQAPKSLTRENVSAPAPAPSPPAAAPPPAPKPIDADIAVGRIMLEGGQVNYTDDFIRPNYSANLTDVAGKVGAFGTDSTEPAQVALQGSLNKSAPIDVSGSINPLAPMASVDIKAKADGIELTGFSPYTTKYTGYPITKGTMTVDVHYQLQNQHLTAENHIFIDQLTFGDKIENNTATNLPIRLAVALLKDPRGQIDLRVPISGSLNDPQFSIASLVLHVFGNLILKAATSPFSLIAATFGSMTGGAQQELNYIEFAPGYDTLTADSRQRLDTIIKALNARPGLKLDISGRVDPKFDTDGLREATVANQIRIQKMRALGSAAGHDYKSIELTKDDYDKYLKAAYGAAKFQKPKNIIGLDKSLPPDEMKKLMLENVDVSEQRLQALADARAAEVRGYLAKQVDPGRLFVLAPKLNADGIKAGEKTTRADLSLE